MIARHLIIHGHVQGVFYRDWTVETARELGVKGRVRNCDDGTVEAELEGEESAVQRMIEKMHEGPPAAQVERIEQSDTEPQGFDDFERD